jgi:methionine-rich copper-binding protein CopC
MRRLRYVLAVIVLAILLVLLTNYNVEAGTFAVSTSTINLEPSKTSTITVTASGLAGRVTISSSNTSVATVNKSSEWVEDNSFTITVTSVGEGTANITVALEDVADLTTGNPVTGTKTVTVTVKAPVTNPDPEPNNPPTPPAKSSNANLSMIVTSPVDFTGFKPSKTEGYSITVGSDVTEVTVKTTKQDSKATVEVTGNKNLQEGTNIINVEVTAEDGTKKVYKITVVKLAAETITNPNIEDAPAVKVALASLTITGGTINEPFNPDTTEYTASVEADVEKIEIQATANVASARVEITGADTLQEGENIVTIKVISQDGSDVKTYTIKVTKAAEEIVPEEEPEDNEITISGAVHEKKDNSAFIKKLAFSALAILIAGVGIIFGIVEYVKGKKDKNGETVDFMPDTQAAEEKETVMVASKPRQTDMDLAEDNSEREDNRERRARGKHF